MHAFEQLSLLFRHSFIRSFIPSLVRFFVPFRFGPYFVEPIVAGLKEDNTPFISAFDLIGAPVITDDFVVGGTCTNNLYGMCESFYRPDMVREGGITTMVLSRRELFASMYARYCLVPRAARMVYGRHVTFDATAEQAWQSV